MRLATAGISFLIFAGLAQSALAQPQIPGGGFSRPTVSPYINLARGNGGGGSNAALNYYGIVRPEQAFRQQASSLQQQLTATNQNLGALSQTESDPTVAVTGRGATFLNYSHYFNTMSTGGSGGSSFGGSRGGSGGFGGVGITVGVGGNSNLGPRAGNTGSRGGARR